MAFAYTTKVTESLGRGQLIVRGYDVTGTNNGTIINLYVTQRVGNLSPDPRVLTSEIYCPDVALSEFLTSFPTVMIPPNGEDLGNNTRRDVRAMGLTGVLKGVLVSSRTILRLTDKRVEYEIVTASELTFIPNAVIAAGPEIVSI